MPGLDMASGPEKSSRHSSRSQDQEYVIFLHQIPSRFRWQELKDVAKEYCPEHVRHTETCPPGHTTGLVIIAGIHNAREAFSQFCSLGIRSHSVYASLNGPYHNRAEISHTTKLLERNFDNPRVLQPIPPPAAAVQARHNYGSAPVIASAINTRYDQQYSYFGHPNQYGASFPAPDARGQATASTAVHYIAPVPYQPNGRHSQQDPYHVIAANAALGTSTRHHPASPSGNRNVRHNTSASSHPTSFSRGRVPRGVQITYLPARCTKAEANKLLARYGAIESGSMRVGSTWACTTVQAVFKSKRDAENIVNRLHGSNVGGKRVQVTFDEVYENKLRSPSTSDDSAGSSEQDNIRRARSEGPVVVDGARGSRHKRPATDSEDESDESSEEDEPRRRGGKNVHSLARHMSRVHVR